jgi:serine protease Do
MDADLAESFGLDRPHGALVGKLTPGGPAEKAGIKTGDVILSVDGKAIENDKTLPAIVSAIRPGNNTELEIWRDSKKQKVTARVVEYKEDGVIAEEPRPGERSGSAAEPTALGLSVRPLTSEEKLQIETSGTLVVEKVTGAAEAAGIQPGDVILGVGGARVKTAAELQAAIKRSGRVVALLIQREDSQVYLTIRTD